MRRLALFWIIVAGIVAQPAMADEFHREELRIAMAAAAQPALRRC